MADGDAPRPEADPVHGGDGPELARLFDGPGAPVEPGPTAGADGARVEKLARIFTDAPAARLAPVAGDDDAWPVRPADAGSVGRPHRPATADRASEVRPPPTPAASGTAPPVDGGPSSAPEAGAASAVAPPERDDGASSARSGDAAPTPSDRPGDVVAADRRGSEPDAPSTAAAGPLPAAGTPAHRPAGEGGGSRGGGGSGSRWWRMGYPAAVALALLSVPFLVWLGVQTILGTTEGQTVGAVADPAAPGYERLVDPTPTYLVVSEGGDGSLASVTLLTLTGEEAGGVVTIPPATLFVDASGDGGTLEAVHAAEGADGVRRLVELALDARGDGIRSLDAEGWEALVAPVAPLTVDNPDPVLDAEGEVAFPSGPVELGAADVSAYLDTRNPGESDLNRMVRIQQFWRAWLDAVAATADRDDVVPGEVDSGLGRFVRALAGDRLELATLPVLVAPLPGSDAVVFAPVEEEIAALVARLVPFPVGSPEGERLRVRLLDGTGDLQHGLGAVRALTGAGAEVHTIGNAAAFDVATTRVIYHDEAQRPRVEALRAALGVGEVVLSAQVDDATDVTVVLGDDARTLVGADASVTTVAPGADNSAPETEGDGDGA